MKAFLAKIGKFFASKVFLKIVLPIVLGTAVVTGTVVGIVVGTKHKCEFASEWSSDANYHWHVCLGDKDDPCEEIADKAAHSWDSGEITTQPTAVADGVKTFTCTVCDKTKTEVVTKLGPTAGTLAFNSDYSPSKVYDGNPVAAPTADDYEKNGDGAVTVEWYQGETKLDGAPTETGTYKVKVSVAGTDYFTAASAEKEFSISSAAGVIAFATAYNPSKTYDGVALTDPVATDYEKNGDGAVTVQWYKGEEPISAPSNAGTYKVKVSMAGTANFTEASAEKEVVIARKSLQGTLNLSMVYDGTNRLIYANTFPSSPYYNETLAGMMLHSNDFVQITVVMRSVNVGAAIQSVGNSESTGIDNYTIDDLVINASIEKASVTKPTVSGTYTYNGSQQTASVATNPLYTVSNNTRTDAGTQNVTVALNDKNNYKWAGTNSSDDLSLAWTIARLGVTAPTLVTDTFTYDGTEKSISWTEALSPFVEVADGCDETGKNAGTYNVQVTINPNNCYWEDLGSESTSNAKTYDWTIAKAYNHYLINDGTGTEADMNITEGETLPTITAIYGTPTFTWYVYDETKSDYVAMSGNAVPTEVGEYRVEISCAEGNNYTAIHDEIEFEIYPKPVDFVATYDPVSIAGRGIAVTGTLKSGTIKVDDEVTITTESGTKQARVKSLAIDDGATVVTSYTGNNTEKFQILFSFTDVSVEDVPYGCTITTPNLNPNA